MQSICHIPDQIPGCTYKSFCCQVLPEPGGVLHRNAGNEPPLLPEGNGWDLQPPGYFSPPGGYYRRWSVPSVLRRLRKNNITQYNMKIKSLFILLFLSVFTFAHAQLTDYSIFDKKFNFYVANDLGRNGYYDQKPIAELMGTMGEEIGPEFVLATGDVHHFDGVRSVNDPLWMTNYELIYSHPELMIDWFSILGNHEYRGNTQAVLDYTNISRRWSMPDRYYTKVFEEKGATIRIVWIDTTPLIDKYRNESDKYPDAYKQDISKQLLWLESVLASAKEDWIIVAGHHPIYAYTPKEESERLDMQKRVDSILRKHNVDMYICGHIHNFQHIRVPGSDIDYVVNSAASLARKVEPIEGTKFCSPEPGFSVCSIDKKELNLRMIDKKGNVLYTVTRKK